MDLLGLGIFAVSLVVFLIARNKHVGWEKFSLLTMGFGLGIAAGAVIAYFMFGSMFNF